MPWQNSVEACILNREIPFISLLYNARTHYFELIPFIAKLHRVLNDLWSCIPAGRTLIYIIRMIAVFQNWIAVSYCDFLSDLKRLCLKISVQWKKRKAHWYHSYDFVLYSFPLLGDEIFHTFSVYLLLTSKTTLLMVKFSKKQYCHRKKSMYHQTRPSYGIYW